MENKFRENFHLKYREKEIMKKFISKDGVNRLEILVIRAINIYDLYHNELSNRIITNRYSCEVNKFDINIVKNKMTQLVCIWLNIRLKEMMIIFQVMY